MKHIGLRSAAVILSVAFIQYASAACMGTTCEVNTQSRLSPKERGVLTRAFVMKWGNYVQRTYNIPVATWADRMVPTFVHANSDNFRQALERKTFESASATLSGRGHRLSDAEATQALSRSFASNPAERGEKIQTAIGSYASDLTFTPLQPCRIVDTRVAGGAIGAGQSRSFNALTAPGGNFAAQGGAGNDCQALTSSEAAAVVINVTAVSPAAGGYATVYPYGYARPATSSLNYTTGAIVNNTVVSRIPTPINSKDFVVYSYAASDYVIDIVGYYSPPVSTDLVTSVYSAGKTIPANSEGDVPYPLCPDGYSRTGGYCNGAGYTPNVYLKETGPFSCRYFNGSSRDEELNATIQCAKVPGR